MPPAKTTGEGGVVRGGVNKARGHTTLSTGSADLRGEGGGGQVGRKLANF